MDYPLSAHFDETDAMVVFDDVLVPWERVFIHCDPELCNGLYTRYERYYLGDPVRLAGTLYRLYDKDIDRISGMLDELEAQHPPPVAGEG